MDWMSFLVFFLIFFLAASLKTFFTSSSSKASG